MRIGSRLWMTLGCLVVSGSAAGMGVAVGNGIRQAYWSKRGFGIQYASNLSFNAVDDAHFQITNQSVATAPDAVSKISFAVSRGEVSNLAELRSKVSAQNPSRVLTPIEIAGAAGYALGQREAQQLNEQYYLLSARGDLLDVNLRAFEAGNGIGLLEPILHSLRYDDTPPKIDQVRTTNRTWIAGRTEKILVHATDDDSGIDVRVARAFVFLDGDSKMADQQDIEVQKELNDEGGGWYSLTVDLNPYQLAGVYKIGLAIWDRAGNSFEFWPTEHNYETPLRNGTDKTARTSVPTVRVKIVNRGIVDTTWPVLHEIQPDPGRYWEWNAGETHRVSFRITDTGSGVDVASIGCDGLNKTYNRNDPHAFRCRSPRADGGDWYSVEVEVNPWVEPGAYQFNEIHFSDRAGNRTQYRIETDFTFYGCTNEARMYGRQGRYCRSNPRFPSFEVNVKNNGPVDKEGPEILAVEVAANVWKMGETQRIRIRATDQLSGIKLGSMIHADYGFGSLTSNFEGGAVGSVVRELPEADLVAEGGDWYHFDFKVGLGRPFEGYVWHLRIEDRAGNWGSYNCTATGQEVSCKTSAGLSLPPIPIRLIP